MMTEKLTTIARPYALAAFEYALENHDLLSWETMLKTAATIAQDKEMTPLFSSPAITQNEMVDIVCGIVEKTQTLDVEKKNFIQLLAEYERLTALPEIAKLFAAYRAEYEKTITVQITSVIALDTAYQQKFVDALTQRLKRKIALECEIDESLLGGAIIRAGDMVIDGSVRGKLNRLLESL